MHRNLTPRGILSVDFLDGFVFRFLQEEHSLGPEAIETLGDYYTYRLKNHVGGLQDYEGLVFACLVRHFPNCRRFMHVGIGIGATTALLALSGRRVLGIEGGARRVRLAMRFREALIDVWPEIQNRYTLIHARYPDALRHFPPGSMEDAVLFFTNFVSERTETQIRDIIQTFPRFQHVILDLRTFCGISEEEAERAALRNRILAAGMEWVGDIPTVPGNFYAHFRRPSPCSKNPGTKAKA